MGFGSARYGRLQGHWRDATTPRCRLHVAGQCHRVWQFVAAAAHAHVCLRLAGVYPASIEFGLKCRARSAAMMREAQGARLLLKRVQVERRKLNRTVRHSTVRRGPSIASPG